ncbi:class II aldolase/adducin family protein [Myxococcota bacterium]|nr:class II aldolase/adducin family protein [Myxococcota bacterium]MBU1537678.1 class II aldolase/adducin family protein [Myxococcota bacterium]
MERLMDKYEKKLIRAGLCRPEGIVFAGMDDELIFNRSNPHEKILSPLFDALSINSLLFARPLEPYFSIMNYLAATAQGSIRPTDTETRTFLHELPTLREFSASSLIGALKHRKTVIIEGEGVVTFGSVSPEQAFVFFSSVCFATFVKFFSDYLTHRQRKRVTPFEEETFQRAVAALGSPHGSCGFMARGPFASEPAIIEAMCQAGRETVDLSLVDSYFGNISFRHHDTIYISQTGSSLDELEGLIDPVPLDNSSCAGVTASSELSAHKEVYLGGTATTILHGHPRFSVIMSMDCPDHDTCENRKNCHTRCSKKRFTQGVPIVPGEVGTGPFGLSKTLPPTLLAHGSAIVYGHGVFTIGRTDFNEPLTNLLTIENTMREAYFNAL